MSWMSYWLSCHQWPWNPSQFQITLDQSVSLLSLSTTLCSLFVFCSFRKRKREEGKGPYVKKPPNAFMLFLKSERKTVQEELGIRNSAAINKVLSERVQNKRELFQAEAQIEADIHALNNPGWSNKANYVSLLCRNVYPSTLEVMTS
uniref:HMG box domain-containing protein n=1 Tax=Gouania willdenowi TaxID=441366 RepID=A0A8C5H4Y2_GOUWI